MLLVTETGSFFTVVKDWDGDFLWVRSQDRLSIERVVRWMKDRHPERKYVLMRRSAWDYEFRVRLERDEWSEYLDHLAQTLVAGKLKPAVAEARGHDHPVTTMVHRVFFFMSENRPSGTLPNWLKPSKAGARWG